MRTSMLPVATIGAVKFAGGPFFYGTPTSLASGSGHLHVDNPIGENFALEDMHQVYLGEEVESHWYH